MDNDLLGLSDVGLASPEPQESSGVLSYANSQLSAGLDPDAAMQSVMDKYGEGQPFAFTYDPTSKQFQDEAANTPSQGGLISLDNIDVSKAPTPLPTATATKPSAEGNKLSPLDDPNSIWYISPENRASLGQVSQDLSQGLGNVGEDIKNAGLDIGQYFTNFGKEHETFTPGAATPKEEAAAKLLGVPLEASRSTYPILDTFSNPSGLGRGSVYKLSPQQQQELADSYYQAHGGDSSTERKRIENTYAGKAGDYDPVSAMLGDDPFIKLLAFPRLANTQKYYLIQNTVHAMDVASNPSQYSPGEVKQASQYIEDIKKQKGESVWKGLQDTWQKFQDNPEEALLGLGAGVIANPFILASPEAKLGDVILGGAARKAGEVADTAERLGSLGVEAAPEASEFAQKVAAQTQRRATQYSALADRAQSAKQVLERSGAALNVAGASAAGAVINTGMAEGQELTSKGTVKPGDLISPAAIGAIAGGGLSALGGGHFLADEQVPSKSVGTEGSQVSPGGEAVRGEAAESPSLSNTLGKMDMFGNAKTLLPLGVLSASLYGYGQLTGNENAKKGAMFLPFGALGIKGEDGIRQWRVDDIHNYKLARDLDTQGTNPKDIFYATGYLKNADGSFTKEIDDSQFKLDTSKLVPGKVNKLEDVLHHPELAQYIPAVMKNTKVVTGDLPEGAAGWYEHKTNTIHIPTEDQASKFKLQGIPLTQRQIFIHELQHAVQRHFGMARGGSPTEFLEGYVKQKQDLIDRQEQLMTSLNDPGLVHNSKFDENLHNELNEVNDKLNRLSSSNLHTQAQRDYLRLQGENEAYATENRLDLDAKQRALLYPEQDMPTKIANQTVRYHPGDLTISEHLAKTGEMDEDGKLRGMVLGEDKLPEEPSIVAEAKSGNQRAITSLYNQYMPRLIRTLHTFLRGKTGSTLGLEAEDLAHIAFERAIRNLSNFRGDSTFYTYLYTVARNAAYDALNKSKRAIKATPIEKSGEEELPATKALTGKDEEVLQADHPMGVKSTVENVPDTQGTPEEHAVAQQTSRMLSHALEQLPEDIRNTVKLVDLVGMSHEEAAAALGVPLGTIKSRLFNAQKTIEQSIRNGKGAQFRKQGGYATPEELKKLLKTGLLLGAGSYIGSQLSNPNHKLRGAIYGGLGLLAAKEISPRGMYQSVRTALSPFGRVDIRYLLNDWDARRASMDLLVSRIQYKIDKLAPSKESQRKITYWLDGDKTVHLTPKERQAALVAKSFYDKVLGEGLSTGVLKDFLTNYVNHEWVEPKLAQKLHEEIANSFPTNMSPKDRHALARKFLTLEKGKQAGLTPKTENVNDLITIYGRSMARAMANKALLEGLKNHTLSVKNGIKAAMPAGKAPYNFVAINHPQLAGIRVSPDIAPSLRFLFHQTGGGVISALEGLNIALKREETGLSLFHPYALAMVHITANPLTRILLSLGEIGKSAIGKSKAHQALLSDGTDLESFVQGLIRNGIKITYRKGQVSDEDINTGFYQGLSQVQNFLARNFPAGGKVGEALKKVYAISDKVVWENFHTGPKLLTAMNAYERLLRNNQKALQVGKIKSMPTKEELFRQSASYTNDLFGGVNWRRLADDATTRVGRLAALAVSTPIARRLGQVMLFAPDWTYSTIRSFVKATDKGSGLEGLLKPRTLADLHRQYLIRNAILIFTLYNGLNVAMSGHPIWENKDPLTVDMGNGERLQINKHFMEVPHAVADPGKFILGKLGTIPSEALEQALKVDYLNPDHMPPMKNRLEHLSRRFEPFALQTAQTEGTKPALLSLSGMPVYGGHRELDPEEAQAKRDAKRATAKKGAETRKKDRMEKLMRGQF